MRAHVKVLLTAALLTSATGALAQSTGTPPATVEAWRQQYEEGLRAEYGWLSVSGLAFLPVGQHRIGSGPDADIPLAAGHAPADVGTLLVTAEGTTLRLASGVEASLNGQPAPREFALNKARRGGPNEPAAPADRVRVDKVEFHLHQSGDRLALRVRDPESPIRLGFQGTRWFPVSDAARVTATLRLFDEPRRVDVTNVLGDNQVYTSPGHLEFNLEGKKVRLLAFTAGRGRLELIFRDATVGRETYGTRFAMADPTGDGRYVIDFNKAYNPPCAYNPYTTCPTPPSQNVLKIAIRAGEKLYDAPHASASR